MFVVVSEAVSVAIFGVAVVGGAEFALVFVWCTADMAIGFVFPDGVGGFAGWSSLWVVVVVSVVSVHVVSLRATVAFSRELSRYSTLIPVLACSITRLL